MSAASRSAAALTVLLAFGLPASAPMAQPRPPPPSFSHVEPADVAIPAGFAGNPIEFFDDFSWRAFIALTWAADGATRGIPNANAPVEAPGVRVFEQFKANWETFRPSGAAPPEWDVTPSSPCPSGPGTNDLVIVEFTKFGEVAQAGFGDLVGPLIAQNGTYVRYLTGYNRVQFDHIADAGFYLRQNLGGPDSPNGAVAVKSAWIDLTGVNAPERFHRRRGWVLSHDTGVCAERELGLVGLHIVIKTPSRPQWIWSTFEHVDTVDNPGISGHDLVFNDRSGESMPIDNPHGFPPPLPTPEPFNVERIVPINANTAGTNRAWRDALAARGSIWRNYQLVMTQWPLQSGGANNHGRPPNTFPGSRDNSSAYANVVMETFHQRPIGSGCMACHDLTRTRSDFIWSVQTHAFPTPDASPEPTLAAFFTASEDDRLRSQLRAALQRGARAHEREMGERNRQ